MRWYRLLPAAAAAAAAAPADELLSDAARMIIDCRRMAAWRIDALILHIQFNHSYYFISDFIILLSVRSASHQSDAVFAHSVASRRPLPVSLRAWLSMRVM